MEFGPLENADNNANDFTMGLFFDSTVAVVLLASDQLDDSNADMIDAMFDDLFSNPIESGV